MAHAKIVYASMTGNTEEIAEVLAEELENLGFQVDKDECTQVDAAEFQTAELCVVASYTYGDRGLPEEILDFYEDLQQLDLSNKIYGVLGSGDTFYETFCKAVDEFSLAFEQTGAIKGAEPVKIDLAIDEAGVERIKLFAADLAQKAAELA